MKYILSHDLGTSGNKASLFSTEGELVCTTVAKYDTRYFNQNWVEQNADDWWDAICRSSKELILSSKVNPKDICAISFSGHMMGCLCVDRDGRPLRPSIIWADQRASAQSGGLKQKISDGEFYEIVGHRNTPSYSLQKLMWIRDNEPDTYRNTYKVLNAKDYIAFKMTGNFQTDHSEANGMGCYDQKKRCWSEKIIACAGIDGEMLPQIKESIDIAGELTGKAAKETGLSEGTPVVIGAGDGVAANVGCGSTSVGKTYCCLGTSAWVATTIDKPNRDEKMRTFTWAHAVPGMFSLMGTMQYAGGSVKWLEENVCNYEEVLSKEANTSIYDIINDEIRKSPVGSRGLIFLPYLIGERAPRWNEKLKGTWMGITPETNREDLLRSVYEGVAMNLDIILKIIQDVEAADEMLLIGGGAQSSEWCRILTDVFGIRVLIPNYLEEACSMGGAIIGGVGVGAFKDFEAAGRFLNATRKYEPIEENVNEYNTHKKLFEHYYSSVEKAFV